MKKYLILLSLSVSFLFAQNEINSSISSVTVFRNNAQIVSDAKGKLPAGTSEIIIRDISTAINPSSLQVAIKGTGKVSLLSATYEMNYLRDKELNAEQESWKNKLEKLEAEIKWVREQKQIFTDLEGVLNANKILKGEETGMNPGDLTALLDIYKSKQYEYTQEYLKFEKEEADLAIEIQKVKNQLNELNTVWNTPTGIIRLQLSAVSPGNVDFKCTYVVSNAGWNPVYDLRSEGASDPVQLVYKANVYQQTGYDWERVNMTVSTGNPTKNNNRPILYPLYVNYYQPYQNAYGGAMRQEKVQTLNMAYADAPMALEDAEEVGFKDGFNYDGQESQTQLTTEYEVQLPQNVASDGKNHLMGLKTYELDSKYAYHTVPKLDKGAFLLAKVSDWGKYNLLPANANIFFEGAYVGQSYIDPNVSSDTLLISMGRDEGIKVSRNQLQDFTSKKILGSNKKESYAFEIEVRNNKSESISIEVLDQIPVSNQKDIVVELEEQSGAKYNEELGKLEWQVDLGPNQSKKLKFVYSVKYPKDRQIYGQK